MNQHTNNEGEFCQGCNDCFDDVAFEMMRDIQDEEDE